MDDNTFPFSRHPSYLEWYLCYDDPSREAWIQGLEILRHPEWGELEKKKWHFFYRPIPGLVGRPQRKMIRERELAIHASQAELRKLQRWSVTGGALAAIVLIWALLNDSTFFTSLSLLAMGGQLGYLLYRWIQSERSIRGWRREIAILEQEIRYLVDQIPSAPSAVEVESWLEQELKAMERKCLSEIVNAEVDDQTIDEMIRHEQICPPVRGLLIQGWGLLQPAEIHGPFGKEKTGVHKVQEDIQLGLATWRPGTQGQPIYRVMYLQYIFLLEKNVNVYGFFYDFVTRRRYGKRSETFQYGHVTNYSIREVDLSEGDWIQGVGLPKAFKELLLRQEIQAFSLAVASGAHFRCVLVDEAVVRSMNEWLEIDEKYRKLEEEMVSSQELFRCFQGDGRRVQSWLEAEEARRNELLKDLAARRCLLEEQDTHLARKALQQVRRCVEQSGDARTGASRGDAAVA